MPNQTLTLKEELTNILAETMTKHGFLQALGNYAQTRQRGQDYCVSLLAKQALTSAINMKKFNEYVADDVDNEELTKYAVGKLSIKIQLVKDGYAYEENYEEGNEKDIGEIVGSLSEAVELVEAFVAEEEFLPLPALLHHSNLTTRLNKQRGNIYKTLSNSTMLRFGFYYGNSYHQLFVTLSRVEDDTHTKKHVLSPALAALKARGGR